MDYNIISHIDENYILFSIKEDNRLALSEISIIDKEMANIYGADLKSKNKILYEDLFKKSSRFAFYNRLNVPKELRGKGIGSLLLNKTLEYCHENNILLINTVNNYGDMSTKELINFYEKNGMKLIQKEGLMIYHKEQNNFVNNKTENKRRKNI